MMRCKACSANGIPMVYYHEYTASIRYTAHERVSPENPNFNYKEVVIKILRNYLRVLFKFNNLIVNKSFAVN